MLRRVSFDYAIIRVVPRVEREEFLNAGAILSCQSKRVLGAVIEIDERRLAAFAPWLDLAEVRRSLDAIPAICVGGEAAGPIGRLPQRQRFHWLVAPRSTVVQTSAVHSGLCDDPAVALERLLDLMVRPPARDW